MVAVEVFDKWNKCPYHQLLLLHWQRKSEITWSCTEQLDRSFYTKNRQNLSVDTLLYFLYRESWVMAGLIHFWWSFTYSQPDAFLDREFIGPAAMVGSTQFSFLVLKIGRAWNIKRLNLNFAKKSSAQRILLLTSKTVNLSSETFRVCYSKELFLFWKTCLRLGKVLYLLLFLRFPGRDCKLQRTSSRQTPVYTILKRLQNGIAKKFHGYATYCFFEEWLVLPVVHLHGVIEEGDTDPETVLI